jgi:hypothetical protein
MDVTCQIIPSVAEQWPSPLMMTMLAPHSTSLSDTPPVPHCLTINISLSNTDADGCERKETHTETHHARESVVSANASREHAVEMKNSSFNHLDNVASLLVTIAGIRFDTPSSDLIACAEKVVGSNGAVLTDSQLNKLSEIVDMIHFHKDGTCKDTVELLRFYEWCNNVREVQIVFGTEHAGFEVVLDETQVTQCFHAFVEEFCVWELTPQQRCNTQYRPKWDLEGKMSVPTKLRDVLNDVFHTKLGNKWVPFRIWQIGAPCMLTGEIEYDVQRVPSENVLQSHLKQLLRWFVALATDVVARENSEGFGMHQQISQRDKPPLIKDHMQNRKRTREDLGMGRQLQKQRKQGWEFNEMVPEHQTPTTTWPDGSPMRPPGMPAMMPPVTPTTTWPDGSPMRPPGMPAMMPPVEQRRRSIRGPGNTRGMSSNHWMISRPRTLEDFKAKLAQTCFEAFYSQTLDTFRSSS